MSDRWYVLDDAEQLASPAVVVFPERVGSNLARMLAIAGGPERLFPHVKTHKLPPLVAAQQALGINRFKCATLGEAEMLARRQAAEVLVAYQLVGPNVAGFAELVERFEATSFASLVDEREAARVLSAALTARGLRSSVYLDLDVGMHRTGIAPGAEALDLAEEVLRLPGLTLAGLHAYDGHIKERDPARRRRAVDEAFAPVDALRRQLDRRLDAPSRLVAGGTPTFAAHAAAADRQLSPGTCVFWDASYEEKYADLRFDWAAVLVTRVISRPGKSRLCLDLGYKSVACDNPEPRAIFPDLPDARAVIHSEEHLAIETAEAERLAVGDVVYAIPYHVCPTIALYPEVAVAGGGKLADRWRIEARDRRLASPHEPLELADARRSRQQPQPQQRQQPQQQQQ